MSHFEYCFFAPLANAHGHFRSIRLPRQFKVERWSRDKIVRLWRQIEGLPKWSIEVRMDDHNCLSASRATGHVVTAKTRLESGVSSSDMQETDKELTKAAMGLDSLFRSLSLALCADVCMVEEYWYCISGKRIEMISASTHDRFVRAGSATINSRNIVSINKHLATVSIPFKREYVQLAFVHWEQALHSDTQNLELLSMVTALEALFNVGQHDIRYRVARSVAVLLGDTPEDSDRIFEAVKLAYDVRSALVHTGKAKGIEKVWSWCLRRIVRDAILVHADLDLPKDKISDRLTRFGFGQRDAIIHDLETCMRWRP